MGIPTSELTSDCPTRLVDRTSETRSKERAVRVKSYVRTVRVLGNAGTSYYVLVFWLE